MILRHVNLRLKIKAINRLATILLNAIANSITTVDVIHYLLIEVTIVDLSENVKVEVYPAYRKDGS